MGAGQWFWIIFVIMAPIAVLTLSALAYAYRNLESSQQAAQREAADMRRARNALAEQLERERLESKRLADRLNEIVRFVCPEQ